MRRGCFCETILSCEGPRLPCDHLRRAGLSGNGRCATESWRAPLPQGCVLESGDLGGSLGWPLALCRHCRSLLEGPRGELGFSGHHFPSAPAESASVFRCKWPSAGKATGCPRRWSPAPCFTPAPLRGPVPGTERSLADFPTAPRGSEEAASFGLGAGSIPTRQGHGLGGH